MHKNGSCNASRSLRAAPLLYARTVPFFARRAALLLMGATGLGLSAVWHDQLWLGMFALCIANAGLISFPTQCCAAADFADGIVCTRLSWR